jgi:hypothetical protein
MGLMGMLEFPATLAPLEMQEQQAPRLPHFLTLSLAGLEVMAARGVMVGPLALLETQATVVTAVLDLLLVVVVLVVVGLVLRVPGAAVAPFQTILRVAIPVVRGAVPAQALEVRAVGLTPPAVLLFAAFACALLTGNKGHL